jgi:hypothetical protein
MGCRTLLRLAAPFDGSITHLQGPRPPEVASSRRSAGGLGHVGRAGHHLQRVHRRLHRGRLHRDLGRRHAGDRHRRARAKATLPEEQSLWTHALARREIARAQPTRVPLLQALTPEALVVPLSRYSREPPRDTTQAAIHSTGRARPDPYKDKEVSGERVVREHGPHERHQTVGAIAPVDRPRRDEEADFRRKARHAGACRTSSRQSRAEALSEVDTQTMTAEERTERRRVV